MDIRPEPFGIFYILTARSLEEIVADWPAERVTARYAEMRRDRLARNGAPAYDPAHAARAAIASEWLEGIDARQWIAANTP